MASANTPRAGEDRPVAQGADLSVSTVFDSCFMEADRAKQSRMNRNKVNQAAYLNLQNWDHKADGQSREFVPKTAAALEQFTGFAKRALTQFGAWFTPEFGKNSASPITTEAVRSLLDCFLKNVAVEDNVRLDFASLLTDGLKMGALESLIVFKVHGQMMKRPRFTVQPGGPTFTTAGETGGDPGEFAGFTPDEPVQDEEKRWWLRIDLIATEEWYPDPTGRGLYEIHRTEMDLYTIQQAAEEGIYDSEAVKQLVHSMELPDDEKREEWARNQDEATKPSFRKSIVVDEYWGHLLDEDGSVVRENIVMTRANDIFLIRPPEDNPFWHKESPFVSIPLIRVPKSVWHRALMDSAVEINLAINELFNLILDGGLASVWGIKQVRINDLEDPSQISGGLAQGDTVAVKSTLPPGAKAIEQVTEGTVPPDAMVTLEMLNREFAAAALSNELKLGSLPPKQVLATEVVELSQSQAVTLDSIIADIEQALISTMLRKAWLTILQNMDDIADPAIVGAMGIDAAFALSQLSPAERFSLYGPLCTFRVHGLSATLSKVRDFQKFMALVQSVSSNPLLLQAFFTRYSPDKILQHMMKTLAINPEQIQRDQEELARLPQDLAEAERLQQLAGGGGAGSPQGGLAAEDTGEPALPAEINQAGNPLSGMGAAQ